MPRYTDQQVDSIVEILQRVSATVENIRINRVAKLELALQYDFFIENPPGGTSATPNDATYVVFSFGNQLPLLPTTFRSPAYVFGAAELTFKPYVPKDDQMDSDSLDAVRQIDAAVDILTHPTVPSNAPLQTIPRPAQTQANTIAEILKAIDRAHKSENDALYEIRIHTQTIKSYCEAINNRTVTSNKNESNILQAINSARIELREAREDLKDIINIHLPHLDEFDTLHFNALLVKIDSIINKLM